MDKPRLRQPADGARARRRSLVELTAAASRAIDRTPVEMPSDPGVGPRDDGSRSELATGLPGQKTPAEAAIRTAIDTRVAMGPSTGAALRPGQLESSISTPDLAAEIAKEMQARALETMKLGVQAAVEYSKDIANPESDLLEGAAAECHAVVLELMKVNAGASLQLTRELSRARTLSEWIELSSSHARKQCELVPQQVEVLKSLTRNATTSDGE